MPDGMADAQREVDRSKLQRELVFALSQKRVRYPKELYKGEVWRVVWSCEEHAAFKIEGWADEKNPGTEYRPYTAVEPITENAASAEAAVPNLAGTTHTRESSIENREPGRPRLPADALQRIVDAEKASTEQLQKSLEPYSPSASDFVFHPVEINAGCWKVIDHLMIFADAIFDAHAREYFKYHPELVLSGDFVTNEIGAEVVERTKLHWTRWETEIDWALRTRWTREYYGAYVEQGNQPDSEDQKLLQHFLKRLSDMVSDNANRWKQRQRAHSVDAASSATNGGHGNESARNAREAFSNGARFRPRRTPDLESNRERLALADTGSMSAKQSSQATAAKEARAITVARLVKELNQLKPQMFEDESEYLRLRDRYPDFLTFKITDERPDLKTKVLAIQGSRRHIRLAQELAGAHHERTLATIQDDWKDFKPAEFKRPH